MRDYLDTRRVFVTPSTFQPDAAWMESQSRAFVEHTATERLPCSIVTRDYDGKFGDSFDRVFNERSIQVKLVGPQAPNLNAFIERWIQSLQHEAVDHFIVFGQEHFDHIVSQYVAFYHECRPHQGLGNVLLPQPRDESVGSTCHVEDTQSPPLSLAEVKCEWRLGGLLKHFYRLAA